MQHSSSKDKEKEDVKALKEAIARANRMPKSGGVDIGQASIDALNKRKDSAE
jgi:hypothetical protein